MTACVNDVTLWMQSKWLQLNTAKTEVVLRQMSSGSVFIGSARRLHQIPTVPLAIGSNDVITVSTVRDLGIYIDSDISFRSHVAKTVSSCFAALRQIRSIKQSISRPVMQSLVVSMVLTRLDYGSETLAGIPSRLMDRLQSVLNEAARLDRRRDTGSCRPALHGGDGGPNHISHVIPQGF